MSQSGTQNQMKIDVCTHECQAQPFISMTEDEARITHLHSRN